MERLDKVIRRNREAPKRLKRTVLLVGGFLLLLIGLYIFLDPPPLPTTERRVRGIELMTPPAQAPRDAGP